MISKGDRWIFIGILMAALAMIGFQFMPIFASRAYVMETVGPEGSIHEQIDGVSAPGWYRDVSGMAGGLRLAYTPEKGFHVEAASCPDQVCVRSGYIHKAGQSIVCVPNEITIRLLGGDREGDGVLDGILQ